ncbi:hypothetical protein LguiA_025407 [Lonicera macranthoides]
MSVSRLYATSYSKQVPFPITFTLTGCSHDWERGLLTTEPEYYKRTQPIGQWMLRIIAYGHCLLEDLDELDWPNSKLDWQVRRAEVEFYVPDTDWLERDIKTVYTTWPDTIFGVTYGTEAIMAVPAHDRRDHESASKYGVPICWVVTPDDSSGLDINGLPSKEAASKVVEWVEKTGNGNKKTTYWGEPIPVIFSDARSEGVPVPENELPLTFHELDDCIPTGTGEPPLAKAVSWVKTTDPLSGKPARRETNTMP